MSFSSAAASHDYATALKYSILFYDANKCGPDAAVDNVFSWRGPCHTTDGSEIGLDLTGGYHDAGDHVKFGLPRLMRQRYWVGHFMNTRSVWRNRKHLQNAQHSQIFHRLSFKMSSGLQYLLLSSRRRSGRPYILGAPKSSRVRDPYPMLPMPQMRLLMYVVWHPPLLR